MNIINKNEGKIAFLGHQVSQLIQQMATMTEKLNNQELKADQAIQKINKHIQFQQPISTPIYQVRYSQQSLNIQ